MSDILSVLGTTPANLSYCPNCGAKGFYDECEVKDARIDCHNCGKHFMVVQMDED